MLYFWLTVLLLHSPPPRVTLAFAGDINFRDQRRTGTFDAVRGYLEAADLAVGNLEGLLLDDPRDAFTDARINITADARHTSALRASGFDLIGLANNHTWDHGADGLREHLGHLSTLTTFGVGRDDASARAAYRYKHNHGCVSLVPATLKSNKKAPPDADMYAATYRRDDLAPLVERLRAERDCFVIAWVHAGKEGAALPTQQTRADFRALAEAADLVIGHHPHVLQGVELTARGAIVYSLGNFLFINQSRDKRRSAILEVALEPRDGRLVLAELAMRAVMIDGRTYLPRPATAKEAKETTRVLAERSEPFDVSATLVDGRVLFTRR